MLQLACVIWVGTTTFWRIAVGVPPTGVAIPVRVPTAATPLAVGTNRLSMKVPVNAVPGAVLATGIAMPGARSDPRPWALAVAVAATDMKSVTANINVAGFMGAP